MKNITQQDLETAVYDIAGGAGTWQSLLDMFFEIRPETRFALVVSTQDGRTQVIQHGMAGYEEPFIKSYVSYYQNLNPWVKLHQQYTRPSAVYTTRDAQALPVQQELFKSEFYNDWVKPQDDSCEGVAMMLGHNGDDTISLAANVPRAGAGELLPQISDTFRSLVKPLSLVASVQMLRNELGLQKTSLELMVGSLTDAALLISGAGRVLYSNVPAGAVFRPDTGIRRLGNGEIQFVEASAQGTRVTNVLLSSLLNRGWRTFILPRGSRHRPMVATIVQLAGYGTMIGSHLPRYLMLIKDPEARHEMPDSKVIEGLLGLTAAEARIALRLADGLRTAEVAEALNLSPNTVRNHISAMLHKTGFTRASDVASFITSMAPVLRGAKLPDR